VSGKRRFAIPPNSQEHDVTCPECDEPLTVVVTAGYAARVSGPPEDCYPEEPWDIETPECCAKCGEKFSPLTLKRWLSDCEWRENEREYEKPEED
jgi:hypothetical protein